MEPEQDSFFDQKKSNKSASEFQQRRETAKANRKTYIIKTNRRKLKKYKTQRSKSHDIVAKLNKLFDEQDAIDDGARQLPLRERMEQIPLAEDAQFLQAIKDELLGLKKRLRHETLQKLQLLKQIKDYRTNEAMLQEKARRLAKLEKGPVLTAEVEIQTDTELSESNVVSQPSDTEGFKHVNERAQVEAQRRVTPPAPPSALRAVPRHIQRTNPDDGKNEEKESAYPETQEPERGLITHAVARSHTIDGNTLEDMTKQIEATEAAPRVFAKSPKSAAKVSNRQSKGLFKAHMQKSVTFKNDSPKRDERTTSDGRTLTRTEYSHPSLKKQKEIHETIRTSYEEKQVPPLQMPRFQVNYKPGERVREMAKKHQSVGERLSPRNAMLMGKPSDPVMPQRQVNFNFNAGADPLRNTQAGPLSLLTGRDNALPGTSASQNFTINVNEGLSLDEYTYAWRQCDYWMQKAEQLRNDQTQWKNSRNQAWKENAQLQNLIKKKQEKILELEKVIKDFNLGHPRIGIDIEEAAQQNHSSIQLPKLRSGQPQVGVGFPVPQVQQSLRISIPENAQYQFLNPQAPLTAKHAPLPELLGEDEDTTLRDDISREQNSLYKSYGVTDEQDEAHNQTSTYQLMRSADKYSFDEDQNQDRNNYQHHLDRSHHTAPHTVPDKKLLESRLDDKSFGFDSAAINRARNRKMKQSNANRMGVRFNDEEDGNGGEEHQIFMTEDNKAEQDLVFEVPNRKQASYQSALAGGDASLKPNVTSNEVVHQYEQKEQNAKERLIKRTHSTHEEDKSSTHSSRHHKKRSVFANILRSIF